MKRIISLVIALICTLTLTTAVSNAAGVDALTLTVILDYEDEPLGGINVAICLAAEVKVVDGGTVYEAAPVFADAQADFTDLTAERNIALAASLNAFASANNIDRISGVTGNDGKVTFTNLSEGLYLVAQMDIGNSEYIIAPYLAQVPSPNIARGGWDNNVVSYPKTRAEKRDITLPISVSVFKVWAGTAEHPASVQAQLYKSGSPEGNPVTLNSDNQWSYTWPDLDPLDTWTVDEINVPDGYTKAVSGDVTNGFVITNTITRRGTEQITISGKKTWNHGANPEKLRPDQIVLYIFGDGKLVLQKKITANDNWSWNIQVDKYGDDGHAIAYTVDEDRVDDYTKVISGYSISNTYKSGWNTDKDSPKTGDDMNMFLWFSLALISLIGLIATVIKMKRTARLFKQENQ